MMIQSQSSRYNDLSQNNTTIINAEDLTRSSDEDESDQEQDSAYIGWQLGAPPEIPQTVEFQRTDDSYSSHVLKDFGSEIDYAEIDHCNVSEDELSWHRTPSERKRNHSLHASIDTSSKHRQ